MRKFSNLKIISFLIVFSVVITSKAFAPPARSAETRSIKRLTPQERRQMLEQEASSASTEVSAKYQEILPYVNSAQAPSEPDLREFLKTIARNRKYLPVFNDSQKATYHILSAWVYYFDDKQNRAAKQAASAQKIAHKNPGSIKTRLALSIIYKDYTSVIEALTQQSSNDRRGPQTDEPDSSSYYQASKDDIQLDVNAVRIELLSKVFDFHPEPVEANMAAWQPAGRLICTLLWKIDANELDSFAPIEVVIPPETNEPNKSPQELNIPQYLPPEPVAKPIPELEEFSKLQTQFAENKKIAFTGINLNDFNDPAKMKNLANWLNKNPQTWQTFILSPQEQQKMLSYLGDGFDKPILLIIAPDSTTRYAGGIEGFLPQMVINSILQNPLEFAEPNEPNKPPDNAEPARHIPAEPNTSPTLSTADANKAALNTQQHQISPQMDANTALPPPPPAETQQQDDDVFSAADNYQAEKLLSNARTFLQIGNRLPSHTYRNPIEWCRQVMRDYPNTKYAREAQMLLRNVPEDHRQQYNLTDEELGL